MKTLAAIVSAGLLLAAAPAAALTVTGWFQGTVTAGGINSQFPPDPIDHYLGQAATGRFTIEIDDTVAATQPFDTFLELPGTMALDVRVRDLAESFRTGPGLDNLGHWLTEDSGDWLGFWSYPRPRFSGFILDFESDDGALRAGPTPADYRLDAGTVDGMSLYFASSPAAAWFRVGITSFGFGGIAAPVPEPTAPLLLAAGLAAVIAGRRRSTPIRKDSP